MEIELFYDLPYDVNAFMKFLKLRAVQGLELVMHRNDVNEIFSRVLQIQINEIAHMGWICLTFDQISNSVKLKVSDSLLEVTPLVIQRTRSVLDLDADIQAIDSVLKADFPQSKGQRVPGAWDGFETAVRAILGQQITVAAGNTLTHRLVKRFGPLVNTPWSELTNAFPSPEVLLKADPEELGQLGILKQRQKAIQSLANSVLADDLDLSPNANAVLTVKSLMQLPGIGDWTAQYIAMRCLKIPNAFPAGDIAIQNRLNVRGGKKPTYEAIEVAKKWEPWRSYAVIRLWHGI